MQHLFFVKETKQCPSLLKMQAQHLFFIKIHSSVLIFLVSPTSHPLYLQHLSVSHRRHSKSPIIISSFPYVTLSPPHVRPPLFLLRRECGLLTLAAVAKRDCSYNSTVIFLSLPSAALGVVVVCRSSHGRQSSPSLLVWLLCVDLPLVPLLCVDLPLLVSLCFFCQWSICVEIRVQ